MSIKRVGHVDSENIPISKFSDAELKNFFVKNSVSLTINEIRQIPKLIGRDPTITEIYIFNTQWSEHSSYKSSRAILKKYLPINAPTVMLGIGEDAGIVYLTTINNERYGIVIGHESHNHPSQVVPYEGAATGIGGIVRDVLCMGARVIAIADPLRFGNPDGRNKNHVRYIANSVIDGIAGYSNPIGVPNLAGDIYFNDSFDENCLVNVVCLGIVKESDIIHSTAPENSEGWDIIIVGKSTDNSGFGGAAFSSLILDDKQRESNRGAVQVPDPFLKNILMRATYRVFEEAKNQQIILGFKDMGAGGIMCSTAEICSAGGYGAVIDLDKVHVSLNGMPPYIIACSETQERFTWISPPEFTKTILKVYNEEFELPNISEGARACVIGRVTKERNYVLRHNGKIVCNADINAITEGIKYEREANPPMKNFIEPNLIEPTDYNKAILKILSHPNVASKAVVYKHYDTEVQGNAVIRPGEADAGVIAPIPGESIGVALKTDCNSIYCRIDQYWGAVNAVSESMRNVAAVGGVPYALTDCLNYGNPENPESFYDFVEGVKGIADAAKNIYLKGTKHPVPFVSGNVSFYNESSKGRVIDQSPIIACVGVIQDYSKAITMKIKKKGSILYMIGERRDELGGSVYYQLHNKTGANIPKIDFAKERGMIYGVIDAINERLILSCHDISDGGLITTVAEMILGGDADGMIGAELNLINPRLRMDKFLFSESSGFVFEVEERNKEMVEKIFTGYGIIPIQLGRTDGSALTVKSDGLLIVDLKIEDIKGAWTSGVVEALR